MQGLVTTKAALDERPDPVGIVPVGERSTDKGGSFVEDASVKKCSKTPYAYISKLRKKVQRGMDKHSTVTLPSQFCGINI
jgi:hypothetical protein